MSSYTDLIRKERDRFEELYKGKCNEVVTLKREMETLEARIADLESAIDAVIPDRLMPLRHHEQCPWHAADPDRTRSVCGCPEGWPK
jgi:hypothetical protein